MKKNSIDYSAGIERLQEKLLKHLTLGQVFRDELMKKHTTFKIGGPADIFIEPHTMEELSAVLESVQSEALPLAVLGCGSNVLVRDGGIRGVVVSLCRMMQVMKCEGDTLTVGSGYMLKDVSEFAWQNGLSGLEFAIGIPGSLGGAVFMNAGAYGGEMSQIVTGVKAVRLDGAYLTYPPEILKFAYRHSIFQDNHAVIGEVTMRLQPGNQKEIKALMDDLTERRNNRQPLEYPSAGSTFKRPPGHFAGTLIEQTGLKGLAVGQAQVSAKHAGFVVNMGDATARDVLGVIHEVQRRVHEAHGVRLEPEVRLIGEDGE